ncbi:MAG TPA: amidase [Candidatus Limnocylindrales bacterium]|nr:amidase [Candidatus Limnocylindrales bacterium]
MTGSDWVAASATDLARDIRTGRRASVEVVSAVLDRIDAVDPLINAVVQRVDGVLAAAERADAALAHGKPLGPLHGLPFTIKDSYDTAGTVTTAGTVGWRDRVPKDDATVVARLRAAGAILVGKTNTPEFTWSDETDNDVYGRTSNPYDLARTPGGSSGGSAAIVAAGASPFDVGSDTADSIRQPSHVCGVAGIKPTSGRVPRTGHSPDFRGLFQAFTQLGPIARRVEDLELILPIIAGPDGIDPFVYPVALRDADAVRIDGLRVATFTDNGIRTPTPETADAVRAAASALADAGAAVQERRPPGLDAVWDALISMISADGHAWLARLISGAGTAGHGSYDTRGWVEFGEPMRGDELTAMVERADAIRSRMLRWMADVDVIVCPAMPQPAILHGGSNDPGFGDTYSDVHNLTGFPAVVVRGGTSPEGLPIGVQLVAGPWREDVALAAARIVEAASGGWQPPPI